MLHSSSTCSDHHLQEIIRAACEKLQTNFDQARITFDFRIQTAKQRKEWKGAATRLEEWKNCGCGTLAEHDCMSGGKECLSSGCMIQLPLENARISSMNLTCSIPMVLGLCATIATMSLSA